MNQLLKFGFILCAVCLASTLVLAVTYEITKPRIEEQLKREEKEALEVIMPGADSFAEKSVGGINYYEATKNGALVGYCVKMTGSGYNGYIRMMVGVTPDGVIEGVEVLEQQETPGLGARIDETKPGEKDPWFLRQFKGKDARTVAVKKDVDAVTGATISSKAVTDAINKTVSELLKAVGR
jgi:electron transport complex protein RnfG